MELVLGMVLGLALAAVLGLVLVVVLVLGWESEWAQVQERAEALALEQVEE
jgi:sensor domain CHASE-containing protein